MCWDVNFYKKQKVQKANSWYLSQICCKTTHTVQTEVWISFFTVALVHLNTEGLYYLVCTQSILFHLPNQQLSCLSSQTCWWTGLTAWGLQFLICILFRVRNESESRGWATFTSATARIWQTKLCERVCASTSAAYLKNEGELFQWLGMCFKQREEKRNTSENKRALPGSTLIWT